MYIVEVGICQMLLITDIFDKMSWSILNNMARKAPMKWKIIDLLFYIQNTVTTTVKVLEISVFAFKFSWFFFI